MKKYLGLTVVLAVVAFGAFYFTKDKKHPSPGQEELASKANKPAPVVAKPVKGFENKKVEFKKAEDGIVADYSAFQGALTQFQQFQQKSILTGNEKAEYQQLFSKANISDAKKLLTAPEGNVNRTVESNHQASVGFLLGAMVENPSDARAAIVEVANNNALNNPQLSQPTKELLAKDKAELLFHALAKDPSLKQDMANVDPVTQKIIRNIEAEHKRNLAESNAEVNQYKSGRW